MKADLSFDGGPPVVPRPRTVHILGIMNIVFAIALTLWALSSAFMSVAMAISGSQPPVATASGRTVTFNLSFMSDPALLKFAVLDVATGLPLNAIMFASGLGLINFRKWGATWWFWAAWVKIVRLVLVYGFFIYAVVPGMSAAMAKMVISIFEAQKMPAGKVPSLAEMTMIYGYTYSAFAAFLIVTGIIYPAISIWMLSRPGVKVALDQVPDKPATSHDPDFVIA